jgi:hypothetical protein
VKRVLVLAHHFPPVGGAGVQRFTRSTRDLPEFGYETTVLTGTGATGGRWTPADATLLQDLSPETKVRRLEGNEPAAATRWRTRSERWLRKGTEWDRWWVEGLVRSAAEIDEVDLVFASMSPFSSARAAARIAAHRDIPWVADLRDPWALDEMMVYPSRLHRWLAEREMERSLQSAAAIVMNTPEAGRLLARRFPTLRRIPTRVIPNGFDAADFEGGPPADHHDHFRIVHTGYLHTDLGRRHRRHRRLRSLLGGEVPGTDILTRSHLYLLQAVEQLRTREPAAAGVIELHLAGVIGAADRILDGVVREHGYLPHCESITLLRSADLLFLPMQNVAGRASIVPGKTYEYLAAQRPILAAVPNGDARDLLDSYDQTFISRPDDTAAIAETLELLVQHWRSAGRSPDATRDVRRFERRQLTSELASLFSHVLGGDPPASATA